MKYEGICSGKFIERINRFVASVDIDGREERVHVKNTGRCRELLIPGACVYLEDHLGRMGSRRLRYSLIAVEKAADRGSILVNMDSQAPNKVVKEVLAKGALLPAGLADIAYLKSEYVYGGSRLDFYAEDSNGIKWFAEVKGVTLEEDGVARFPDAPTERGVRHMEELIAAVEEGHRAGIIFVIQMKGVHTFMPNDATHREFGETLRKAAASGVEVLAYDCLVTKDSLHLDSTVVVQL